MIDIVLHYGIGIVGLALWVGTEFMRAVNSIKKQIPQSPDYEYVTEDGHTRVFKDEKTRHSIAQNIPKMDVSVSS